MRRDEVLNAKTDVETSIRTAIERALRVFHSRTRFLPVAVEVQLDSEMTYRKVPIRPFVKDVLVTVVEGPGGDNEG